MDVRCLLVCWVGESSGLVGAISVWMAYKAFDF